jgi:hypothetical protein
LNIFSAWFQYSNRLSICFHIKYGNRLLNIFFGKSVHSAPHNGTQNRILGKSLTVHNMYYSECGSGWFFFPLLTEKRNKLLSPGGEWTVNTCFFDSASADLYLENEIKFATFILFKKVELSSWHVLMACSIFFKIGVVKVNLIFNYGKQRVGSRRP